MSATDRYGVRGNAPESSITYADVNREEVARNRRIDERSELPEIDGVSDVPGYSGRVWTTIAAGKQRTPTGRTMWAGGKLSTEELMARCRTAANLKAPDSLSTDHREDVAALLISRHVESIGRAADDRVSLRALCNEARNVYRSMLTEFSRRDEDLLMQAAIDAATPAGLGIGPEDAQEAAMRAELKRDDAYRTAGQLCRRLRFKAMPDTPVWLSLYCWLTSGDAESVAADRCLTVDQVRDGLKRGGAQFRASYGPAQLLAVLSGDTDSTDDALADLLGVVLPTDHRDPSPYVGVEKVQVSVRHHTTCLAPRPNVSQPDCEPAGRWTAHTGSREPYGAAMAPQMKRDAYRWARAEYRARMYGAGQAEALQAEGQNTARRLTEEVSHTVRELAGA